MDNLKKEINKINKEIGLLKKKDKEADVSPQMASRQALEKEMEEINKGVLDLTI